MNIPWEQIIEIVLALIEQCFARGASDVDVRTQLRNPGPIMRFRLERAIRLHLGLRPSQWRRQYKDQIMPEVYEVGRVASDGDLNELIAEARESSAGTAA